ncbi:MAG: outer membrane protein assembly factor BamD [Rikenellaceae bacterium]
MLLLVGVIFGSCNTLRYLNEEDPDVIYDRALELYGEERWSKASRNFEKVMQNYMGTPREDSIIFYNSRCKFKDGDYYTAISYFNSYRMQFSRSPFLEDAEGMLTLSYYYISPGPERDPANIHQALSSIDEFHSRYPQSENYDMFTEIKEELIQRLHDRAYLSAYTYYKTGHYKAAIVALRNALKEYPTSTNRENIMYYMVVSAYELARNSIPSLEVDRYMATIDMYYTFVAEFPTSEYVKDLNRIHDNAKAFLEKRNTDLVEGESIL